MLSEDNCTLEGEPDPETGLFPVRMGLKFVKGMSVVERERLLTARLFRPFADLEDFVRRARPGEKSAMALAECGALECFGGSRRQHLWEVRGLLRDRQQTLDLARPEVAPAFADLSAFNKISWDYQRSLHSTIGHPLRELRPALSKQGLPDAATLNSKRDGSRVKFVAVVITRQRPGTAKGVTFMTLEDESGFVNLVVWQAVFDRYPVLARTASLLGVTGKIQSQQGVVHLIADELWEPLLPSAPRTSRDFR